VFGTVTMPASTCSAMCWQ